MQSLFIGYQGGCTCTTIPVLPKLITLLIFLIYNSKIPYQAKIGRGSTFGYGGMGVVIHSKSIIGVNCTICQQVSIGG